MGIEFDLSKLIVDPEHVRSPGIHKISVYMYNISFANIQNSVDDIYDEVEYILKEKFYYKKRRKKRMREGFISINRKEESIESIYAKESPTKIVYIKPDLSLDQKHLTLVNSNMVKSTLSISPNGVRLVTFGGNDALIKKTVKGLQNAMRGKLQGGYKNIEMQISQDEMRNILTTMENVKYLVIDPGDSDKFISRINRMGKEEIEYKVYANFRGTRINMSPVVTEIIKEEGIRINLIQGRMNLGVKPINTKIESVGKIQFIIPDDILPKNVLPQDLAEDFYRKIMLDYGK